MICFEIPGEPGAKGRPRFSTRGGFVKTYTDKKTELYRQYRKSCSGCIKRDCV